MIHSNTLPPFQIHLEYPIHTWEKFGDVGGVELRGKPELDLAILFLSANKRIGIQLDGEAHRGMKGLHDENQVIVLNAKWGKTVRFIKDEDDRIWGGDYDMAFEQIKEKIEPILKDFGFLP